MGRKHKELEASITVSECSYSEAMAQVEKRHRRRGRLPAVQVTMCLRADSPAGVIGYAVIGVPCSPKVTGREVRRVVSWGWGAASALYRAAQAAGATLTYTDEDEDGHSLRAAGWWIDRRGRTGPYWGNRPGRAAGPAKGVRVRWRPPAFHGPRGLIP